MRRSPTNVGLQRHHKLCPRACRRRRSSAESPANHVGVLRRLSHGDAGARRAIVLDGTIVAKRVHDVEPVRQRERNPQFRAGGKREVRRHDSDHAIARGR